MHVSTPNYLLPFMLLTGTPAHALQGRYNAMGRVARPDEAPAARVIVRTWGQTGLERQILTDDLAKFEIRDLASLLIRENRPHEAATELETYLAAVPEPFDGARLRSLLARLWAAP